MKGSYVSVERLVRNDIEEGELAILLEKGHIACLEPSPDVSPSLLRQTVTPRTLAKANAQWRQITKKENYEREPTRSEELSRLHALCNKQKSELTLMKDTEGRRMELELLLKQCLLDMKSRLTDARNSLVIRSNDAKNSEECIRGEVKLSMGDKDEFLKLIVKMEQLIKLLRQNGKASTEATKINLSWLDSKAGEIKPEYAPVLSSARKTVQAEKHELNMMAKRPDSIHQMENKQPRNM